MIGNVETVICDEGEVNITRDTQKQVVRSELHLKSLKNVFQTGGISQKKKKRIKNTEYGRRQITSKQRNKYKPVVLVSAGI